MNHTTPIPAPIFMSDNMQAGVPMETQQPNHPVVHVTSPNSMDHRFGVKIKVAALVAIAFVVLSSHPFYTIMNSIVCSFSITAAPCVSETGPTTKGIVIAGIMLFIFTIYLLRVL